MLLRPACRSAISCTLRSQMQPGQQSCNLTLSLVPKPYIVPAKCSCCYQLQDAFPTGCGPQRAEPFLRAGVCTPIIIFIHDTTSAAMYQCTFPGLVVHLVGLKTPPTSFTFESSSPTHHSTSASPFQASKQRRRRWRQVLGR